MRKNVLALSIATMIGGLSMVNGAMASVLPGTGALNTPTSSLMALTNASSLQLAPGGIGHILVVPYFTAQSGNGTVLSLVNTDTLNGKAIKVRFRGAGNSDDILDFTLLMSPGDVWTGLVNSSSPTTAAQFTTGDRSCTYPSIAAAGGTIPFVTARLSAKAGDVPNNTREGYVEIFNMADIPPNTGLGTNTHSALYTTIKHVNGTAPCVQSVIDAAILTDNTTEAIAAGKGLSTPTTGLMSNYTIINVPLTTTFSASATSVRALSATELDGNGNYVLFPQLATALNANNFTSDPLLRTVSFTTKSSFGVTGGATTTSVVTPGYFDLPDLSTPYITDAGLSNTTNGGITGAALNNDTAPRAQAAILTKALAVKSIINEYVTDSNLGAFTDWVFSFPTRRYSVAVNYTPTTPIRQFSLVSQTVGGNAIEYFHDTNTAFNTANTGQLCVAAETAGQNFYDREEASQTITTQPVFSPNPLPTANTLAFCGEVSILSFRAPGLSSVLASTVARQDVTSTYVNGWSSVNVNNNGIGLPLLGAAYIKLVNGQATPGTSGTYGITYDHRYKR